MHHVETVHVLQPVGNVNQLNESVSSISTRRNPMAYELDPINPFIPLRELVDVAVTHPFGYHRELVLCQVYTKQR